MAYNIVAIVVLSLLVGIWSANVGPTISDEHNVGQCEESDIKKSISVVQTNVYYNAAPLSTLKRIIVVPETGQLETPLSCIKVMNLDTSCHGGYALIMSGGIGAKHVQIQLTSAWEQPLNFRIEVYRQQGS